MSLFGKPKPKAPAHAPWPSGVDFRYVWMDGMGTVGQLRPGAFLIPALWFAHVWMPGNRYRDRSHQPLPLN